MQGRQTSPAVMRWRRQSRSSRAVLQELGYPGSAWFNPALTNPTGLLALGSVALAVACVSSGVEPDSPGTKQSCVGACYTELYCCLKNCPAFINMDLFILSHCCTESLFCILEHSNYQFSFLAFHKLIGIGLRKKE